ncbi:C69 family dipeptidase [Peristeroidobacter soli]|uniref:C69 family dipeptidase n=1 Tax=Peristeroidobacter soli TaxID=2497877 RepID=UPI00101DE0D9|nr:C69 family dipeptidase [Peristeroidobacter soli]
MCDTILAPPGSTAGEAMLYGKNSDRQRNEAQAIERLPSGSHEVNASLKCTYIAIPQVSRTNAVLLCRPFWMWGAEMGANEHGVVIGNQAVHARNPAQEAEALLGDDLVRLGLERASSAAEAVEVITRLLERFGQGGNNGHITRSYFNNAFMIADATDAFVLETLGREWLLERVSGVRAMSNRYSIQDRVERVSPGLPALLRDSGWSSDAQPRYADVIANPNREHIGHATARRQCSTSLLNLHDGGLTALGMMRILRDHGTGEGHVAGWQAECAIRRTVCMHAGPENSPGQTTGSMVSDVRSGRAIHWVTGSAAPCTSIFKPVLLDVPLPDSGPAPSDRFDAATLWWRHERLHRAALLGDFNQFLADIADERDALERDFDERIKSVMAGGSNADRAHVVAQCWQEAMAVEARWLTRIPAAATPIDAAYVEGWDKLNRVAGLELSAS